VVSRKLNDKIRRKAFQDDLFYLQVDLAKTGRQLVEVDASLDFAYLPLQRINGPLQPGCLVTFYHSQQREASLKDLGECDSVRKHTLGQEGSVKRN
jgi:hypothetical protein